MTKELCPQCKRYYYEPDKFEKCYRCNMKDEGKTLCAHCLENYYDDKEYPMCYECWEHLQKDEGTDEPLSVEDRV